MQYSVLDLYTQGLSSVLNVQVILLLILGVFIGVFVGAMPGLTATMGIAVITPVTYTLGVESAFALLLGVYCGGVYGGSITAVIAKIPGTPSAMMTTMDGYPMGQRGEAGKAIGIATVSSCIGGFISTLLLSVFAPLIASFALSFSAQEYFAIAVFGLCIIAYISEGNIVKGLIAAVTGLLLATIGVDPITGYSRFVFGNYMLMEGIQMIPLLIGIFGFAEVLSLAMKEFKDVEVVQKIGKVYPTLKELKSLLPTITRSSVIGTIVGAIPAAGGTIASIIAYGVEKRFSKHPEKFGTGIPEGIAAPEAANNATTGGSMIPLLTLGIPGDAATAILIGALLIHGLTPGPNLFSENMPIVSAIFIIMAISNIVFLFVGGIGARVMSRAIGISMSLLIPMISMFCIVGAYAIRYSTFDIFVLILFGVVGFLFGQLGIPTAPLVLGFVLGELVESGLRRGLLLSEGSIVSFISRPISTTFLVLSVLMLLAPVITGWIRKMMMK
ncbi:MAG: tripartite tricarboxylate transporter permease [Dorea sp.]